MNTFSVLLRDWRQTRRYSQLDLAMAADVSARHLSFLETGRSRPSIGMIQRLGEVLQLPLDAQNRLLTAAGFAPRYAATPLDAAEMAPVTQAVRWMLDRHAPYPALALDQLWNVQMMNAPARLLFAPFDLTEGGSLLELTTSPLMPQVVENWPEVAYHSAVRLRAESAAAGGIAVLDAAADRLAQDADPGITTSGPTIPTIFRMGDQRLSLFGTIAQFSTAADETLSDLRIELFFPADDDTGAVLQQLAGDACD